MVAQKPIVDRYRRYKAGTKQVVKWLVATAHQCSSDISRRFDSTATLAAGAPLRSTRTYQDIGVSTAELKEFAVAISIAEPSVAVPTDILRVLNDVVDLRKECLEWYTSQATSEEAENKRHAYFVRTLEEIQRVLRPGSGDTIPPVSTNAKQRKSKAKANRQLNNLFQSLELEEPTATPLGCAPSADRQTPEPEITLTDDEDFDKRMALFCFLTDVNDTRNWLRTFWEGYRDHLYSLDTAGIVTETAFGIIQRTYNDFLATHPQFNSWDSIVEFLQFRVALNNNVLYIYPKEDIPLNKPVHKSDLKMADLLCTPGNLILEAFEDACETHRKSIMENRTSTEKGYFIGDIPTVNSKYPASRFQQLVFSLLPEINATMISKIKYDERLAEERHNAKLSIPSHDITTERMRELSWHRNTKFTEALLQTSRRDSDEPIPFWSAIICQCQMDIYDVLGEVDKSCGGDALVVAADSVIATCKSVLQIEYPPHVAEARANEFGVPRAWAEGVKEIIQGGRKLDAAREKQKRRNPRSTGLDIHEINQKRRAMPGLDILPAVAGENLYCLKTMIHDLGSEVTNDLNNVLGLAHFYKAGRRYGILDCWDDMEFLVLQHSTVRPYITETHTAAGPYAMLKHFLLDWGVDPATLAKQHVPAPPPLKQTLPKAKRITSTVSPLRKALAKLYAEHKNFGVKSEAIWNAVLENLTADSESKNKNDAKHRVYTPTQLLDTLKVHLVENEPRLNFNYVEFSHMCLLEVVWGMFLHATMGEMMYDIQPVYYLMKSAADAEASSKPIKNTAFFRAAAWLNKHIIKKRGAEFSQAAYSKSSGHLPKPSSSQAQQVKPPDLEDSLRAVEHLFADSSIGSSRSAIEIYHPTGSAAEFKRHLTNDAFEKIMRHKPASRTLFKGPSLDADEYNAEMRMYNMQGQAIYEDDDEPPPLPPSVLETFRKMGFGTIIA